MPFVFNPFTGTFDAVGSGIAGPTGPAGPMGMPGLEGFDGEDGLPLPGPQGPLGPQGNPGGTGPQGPIGPLGFPGFDGLDGEDGFPLPGPQGPQGATGAPGGTGAQGPQGLMGFPGTDGDDGLDAIFGIPGPQGNVGPQGLQGIQGLPGGIAAFAIDTDGLIDQDPVSAGLPTGGDPLGQYWLLAGRPGGQIGFGGTNASDNATIRSTSSATKGFVQLDDQQQWWPSMPSFAAATTETRRLAAFSTAFTTSPNSSTVHTLYGLEFNPAVTSVGAGGFSSSSVIQAVRVDPTISMAANVIFAGVQGAGTYTATAGATFGSWGLFTGTPTLTSATATVPPYPPIVFSSAPTVTYNATGAATLAFLRELQCFAIFDNLSSGTHTLTDWQQVYLSPTVQQTAGTTAVTTLHRIQAVPPIISGSPTIGTDVVLDVGNLNIAQTTTPIAVRSAITSSATARAIQDTGGALSQFIGMHARSYTPTSQTIPTGYYSDFVKTQQWTGTQRLTAQGTARVYGHG